MTAPKIHFTQNAGQNPAVVRQNPILEQKIRTVRPDAFAAPHVLRNERVPDKTELRKLFRKESATEFVGTLTPGCHMFGLSKGQFSLVDIIREVSNQIGPCSLTLSTWTVADADLRELQALMAADRFPSIRFLLDFSFQRRQPALIGHIRKTYGPESVVVTRNHAKMVLFGNARWQIVCRTSMNLNFNPRLEDVELKDDATLYQFLDDIFNDLFRRHEPTTQASKSSADLSRQFAAI